MINWNDENNQIILNLEMTQFLEQFYNDDFWVMEADKGEKINSYTKEEIIDMIRKKFC